MRVGRPRTPVLRSGIDAVGGMPCRRSSAVLMYRTGDDDAGRPAARVAIDCVSCCVLRESRWPMGWLAVAYPDMLMCDSEGPSWLCLVGLATSSTMPTPRGGTEPRLSDDNRFACTEAVSVSHKKVYLELNETPKHGTHCSYRALVRRREAPSDHLVDCRVP